MTLVSRSKQDSAHVKGWLKWFSYKNNMTLCSDMVSHLVTALLMSEAGLVHLTT